MERADRDIFPTDLECRSGIRRHPEQAEHRRVGVMTATTTWAAAAAGRQCSCFGRLPLLLLLPFSDTDSAVP